MPFKWRGDFSHWCKIGNCVDWFIDLSLMRTWRKRDSGEAEKNSHLKTIDQLNYELNKCTVTYQKTCSYLSLILTFYTWIIRAWIVENGQRSRVSLLKQMKVHATASYGASIWLWPALSTIAEVRVLFFKKRFRTIHHLYAYTISSSICCRVFSMFLFLFMWTRK